MDDIRRCSGREFQVPEVAEPAYKQINILYKEGPVARAGS